MNKAPTQLAADRSGEDFSILSEFLTQADVVISNERPRCELSGRCCQFAEYGHTLFLSHWEAEFLLKDGLPTGAKISPDDCPFQINKLCTAREKRPLGCRTYFCDPAYQEQMPEVSEKLIRELKDLHEKKGRGWDYRPLIKFLEDFKSSSL